MFKDFNHWPSKKMCFEADRTLPIPLDLELHVRAKCAANNSILIPNYMSKNKIDYRLIINDNDIINRNINMNVPPLLNNNHKISTPLESE